MLLICGTNHSCLLPGQSETPVPLTDLLIRQSIEWMCGEPPITADKGRGFLGIASSLLRHARTAGPLQELKMWTSVAI